MTLDDILNEINKAETIVVLAHENPDGDPIGSSLAVCLALQNMGKTVEVLMNEYPANFSFLPGIENIKTAPSFEKYDMAIVVDCPDISRVYKDYIPCFEKAKVTAEFDHHRKNTMFADYNIVNHVSPACAQILVSSFEYLNINITKEIATNLITGIRHPDADLSNTPKDENIKLAFLPYCNHKDILEFPEGDFLFSHQDIQGSIIRGSFTLPDGIDPNILKDKYVSTGIGCVKYKNVNYWVQVFSSKININLFLMGIFINLVYLEML